MLSLLDHTNDTAIFKWESANAISRYDGYNQLTENKAWKLLPNLKIGLVRYQTRMYHKPDKLALLRFTQISKEG